MHSNKQKPDPNEIIDNADMRKCTKTPKHTHSEIIIGDIVHPDKDYSKYAKARRQLPNKYENN